MNIAYGVLAKKLDNDTIELRTVEVPIVKDTPQRQQTAEYMHGDVWFNGGHYNRSHATKPWKETPKQAIDAFRAAIDKKLDDVIRRAEDLRRIEARLQLMRDATFDDAGRAMIPLPTGDKFEGDVVDEQTLSKTWGVPKT